MNRQLFWTLAALLAPGISPAAAADATDTPLVRRQWFETRTAHFNIYSCGTPQEVNKVAGQLEEFCEAYALLAGSQAVASPPIVVMAFPDHEAMKPFLPLYHGQPENLAGFFQHGNDENLIVLSLPDAGAARMDMTVVFHEYTHLLFRRNDRIWPLWLKEGMAELYSTFETTGYSALIAQPIGHHLQLLAHEPLAPLTELFAVTHDSPQYNERERQGIFYAESWLLTHFLVDGDNPAYKSRFANFTTLLRRATPRAGLHQLTANHPAGGRIRAAPLPGARPIHADSAQFPGKRCQSQNLQQPQSHAGGKLFPSGRRTVPH